MGVNDVFIRLAPPFPQGFEHLPFGSTAHAYLHDRNQLRARQ